MRNPSTKTRKIHNVSINGGFTFLGLYDANNVKCELPCAVPPLPLGSQNRIDVRVRFAPGQPGTFQGKVTLYTDDLDAQMLTATLSGTGTGPLLVLGQSSVVFGAQKLNTPTTRTITVLNLGNTQFSQKPSATAPFSVPNANLTIPAGGSNTLVVTFNPNLAGDFTGLLKLAPELSVCPTPPSAWLYGQGLSPAKLRLTPDTLAFSQTAVGTSSAPQEVTVTNDGDSLLTVNTMALLPSNAPFQVTPSGSFSLASKASQRLQVTFRPTPTSGTAGTLTFDSNDTSAPSLKLSGDITPGTPCLGINPLSFDFGEQGIGKAASQKVTVSNTGTVALTLTPTVTGSTAFTVNPTETFTLAPGSAGRELFVTFKPTATENGDVHGQLTFGASPATTCLSNVPLKGTARKTALEVKPTSLDFGRWSVGDALLTRKVTLSNTTNWPVKVFYVPPETLAPYTLSGIPTEGLTIAAGDTTPLEVTFAATTWDNDVSRTLHFQTDATEPVASVEITGVALAPELTLENNDTLTFPSTAPGTERLADATLHNSGNQALYLTKIVPDDEAYFQVVDFQALTVQPNDSVKVKVRFRPATGLGNLETRLRFYTTNNRQLTPSLLVKGTSSGPNALFTRETIEFGYKQIELVHANTDLFVSNAPNALESIKMVSVQVSGPGFSVDPLLLNEPELARGSKRTQPFRVTFSPTQDEQQYDGVLTIGYRGLTTNITTYRSIALQGKGAHGRVTSTTETLEFLPTLPKSSRKEKIRLDNPGQVDVEIATITATLGAIYTIQVLEWPQTIIPAKGFREIEVTFTPPDSGIYSTKLKVTLEPRNTVTALEIGLTGVAAVAKLETDKPLLVFNDVPRLTSKTLVVNLKNAGSAPLTIYNATGNNLFTVKLEGTRDYPVVLNQNQSVNLEVTFRPDTTADVLATLHVSNNSNDAPDFTIQASGRGTEAVLVLPGAPGPQFAPQAISTEGPLKEIVVRNDGRAVLEVYSVSVPGSFCLRAVSPAQGDCQTSLPKTNATTGTIFTVAPGAVHTFYVSAKPTATDDNEALLSIVSNATTTPNTQKLTVKGVGGLFVPSSVVNFGPVNFGSTGEQFVTVINSGITAAQVSVIFQAGNSEFFAPEPLPLVPAGGNAPLKLLFRPLGSTAGPRTVKATVGGGAPGQDPLELTLHATATSVRMAVTRKDEKAFDGALDFGGTRVNTSSDYITLQLTHLSPVGSADAGTDGGAIPDEGVLTIKDVRLDGEDARAFILGDLKLPAALPRNGTLDVPLQFHPDVQRRFNAVLRITSDDSQSSTTLVTLGGRGRTNQLSLSTPTLEFGARVAESSTSAVRSVRLTNESLQPLQVKGLEIIGVAENSEPSHFSLESAPALPITLAAQESRDISVKFVPRPDVTSKAALLVVTNDLESPDAQVSLSGRGLSTVFRALNRTVDFGTVRQSEPATTKVVLTNDTTQELVLMPPKVEGPQAASFVVVSPLLGAEGRVLPQGDSLTLDLKYDTTQIGAAKATLVLGTKDQERAALVALSGVSVASFLTIEPFELDLGWVDIGATSAPRTVTLTNQSASPARLSVVENTNPAFVIDASALDAELAPGAQTTVGVTFRGDVGGPAEGTLKLRLRGETTAEATLTLKGNARTLGGTGGGCACGTSGDGGAALALLLLLGLGLARQGRRAQAED
ncbi:choice-of-anchor D domain-containing protein [Corallococcus sp. M7]